MLAPLFQIYFSRSDWSGCKFFRAVIGCLLIGHMRRKGYLNIRG